MAYWQDTLPTLAYAKNAQPENVFLVCDIIIKDDGDKQQPVPQFFLIDSNGRKYESIHSDRTGLMFAVNLLATDITDQIKPHTQRQGKVIFDVPKQSGYTLKVSGDLYNEKLENIKNSAEEKLICRVVSAYWQDTLPTLVYGKNAQPENVFLVFDIIIKNDGDKQRSIPRFFLIGRNNRKYESIQADKSGIRFSVNLLTAGVMDQIKPHAQMQGRVIFDVPKQGDYFLKASMSLKQGVGDVIFKIAAD